MPMFDFVCEVCGMPGREWRYAESPPRFCNKECKNRGLSGQSLKPVKWPITDEIHSMIEKVYKRDTGNGQVRALARRLGYPRWKLSRYAIKQGWTAKKRKEPDWTVREVDILERNAHLSPERIQMRLKKAGYRRSLIGIVLKRKRMKMLQNLDGQSASSLAICLGVDIHFVLRAIKGGRLRAKRRETHRTERQGGEIYYITDRMARDYILNWLNEIDIRKVDKEWFVDLVANSP